MGSKNKKRPGRSTATDGGGLRQEVERLIAKERLKDAVKQAKLCFQAEGTPENHHLLERAYFLRADELLRRAMPTAAREVAGHLLEFRVTDPNLVEEVVGLLLSLGMSREARELQGRIDAPEARARFAGQEADLTVVHPERAPRYAGRDPPRRADDPRRDRGHPERRRIEGVGGAARHRAGFAVRRLEAVRAGWPRTLKARNRTRTPTGIGSTRSAPPSGSHGPCCPSAAPRRARARTMTSTLTRWSVACTAWRSSNRSNNYGRCSRRIVGTTRCVKSARFGNSSRTSIRRSPSG